MKHKQRHKHKESHIMNHKQRFFLFFHVIETLLELIHFERKCSTLNLQANFS